MFTVSTGSLMLNQEDYSLKKMIFLQVSAAITWKGVTGPFFVREKGLKVSRNQHLEHLQNDSEPCHYARKS